MKKYVIFLVLSLSCLSGVALAATGALHNPQADYPGSPELPLTRELITKLYELNEAGQIFQAWVLLGKHKDGYAVSAAKIFGDSVTVGKCVVESNWKIVVGEQVRKRLYYPYAKFYQQSYIQFLERNLRYPNTLDIEKLYRDADDYFGLPQTVSVDLLFNTVPTDWDRRVFFDRLSSLFGVGRLAMDKRWYDYTEMSPARVVSEYITARDVDVAQAKSIFRKTSVLVAKCMTGVFKPKKRESHHD